MLRPELHVPTLHSQNSPAPVPSVVLQVACSDALSALELGNTYTQAPDFGGTAAGLFQATGSRRMAGRTPNPLWLTAPVFARPGKALR